MNNMAGTCAAVFLCDFFLLWSLQIFLISLLIFNLQTIYMVTLVITIILLEYRKNETYSALHLRNRWLPYLSNIRYYLHSLSLAALYLIGNRSLFFDSF